MHKSDGKCTLNYDNIYNVNIDESQIEISRQTERLEYLILEFFCVYRVDESQLFYKIKENTMNEIERKYFRNFTIRSIIYCIIYVIASMIIQFKVNTYMMGAFITFLYVFAIDIDTRISIKRTTKELENLQNQHKYGIIQV